MCMCPFLSSTYVAKASLSSGMPIKISKIDSEPVGHKIHMTIIIAPCFHGYISIAYLKILCLSPVNWINGFLTFARVMVLKNNFYTRIFHTEHASKLLQKLKVQYFYT